MKVFKISDQFTVTNDTDFPTKRNCVVMGYVDASGINRYDATPNITFKVQCDDNNWYLCMAQPGDILTYEFEGIGKIIKISGMGQALRFTVV